MHGMAPRARRGMRGGDARREPARRGIVAKREDCGGGRGGEEEEHVEMGRAMGEDRIRRWIRGQEEGSEGRGSI